MVWIVPTIVFGAIGLLLLSCVSDRVQQHEATFTPFAANEFIVRPDDSWPRPEPGDMVSLIGGETYRRGLPVDSGVTYRSIGEGKARFEGATQLGAWATGQTIISTALPAGTFLARENFRIGGEVKQIAQSPAMPDAYFTDRIELYHKLPLENVTRLRGADGVWRITLTDPRWISDRAQPDHFDSSVVSLWTTSNSITLASVEAYDPATGELVIDSARDITGDRLRYSILNHPDFIAAPGQWATRRGRIYYWPDVQPTDEDPGQVTARGDGAIAAVRKTDVTLRGLIFSGWGMPTVEFYSLSGRDILVDGCEFIQNININSARTRDTFETAEQERVTIRDSVFAENHNARGIKLVGGSGHLVERNAFTLNGGTCIYLVGGNGTAIQFNVFSRNEGIHGNGISTYDVPPSGSVGVFYNTFLPDSSRVPYTVTRIYRGAIVYVIGNRFLTKLFGTGKETSAALWPDPANAGSVRLFNNQLNANIIVPSDGAQAALLDARNNALRALIPGEGNTAPLDAPRAGMGVDVGADHPPAGTFAFEPPRPVIWDSGPIALRPVPEPTTTPAATSTSTPDPTPNPSPTPRPSATPTATPSPTPLPSPTATPSYSFTIEADTREEAADQLFRALMGLYSVRIQ